MRSLLVSAVLMLGLFSTPAFAQHPDELCPTDIADTDLLACTLTKPEKSAARVLGYANLGANAYARGDYESALNHWLNTMPDEVAIDVRLHTERGYLFAMTGRDALALHDAELAFALLKFGKQWRGGPPISPADYGLLYPLVIDTLIRLKSSHALAASDIYLARKPTFWGDHMERATVLTQLSRLSEALVELDAAEAEMPGLAIIKSNRCITLSKMGRTAEALPLCEQAVRAEPDKLNYQMTLAQAYALAGFCDKAQETIVALRTRFPSVAAQERELVCSS